MGSYAQHAAGESSCSKPCGGLCSPINVPFGCARYETDKQFQNQRHREQFAAQAEKVMSLWAGPDLEYRQGVRRQVAFVAQRAESTALTFRFSSPISTDSSRRRCSDKLPLLLKRRRSRCSRSDASRMPGVVSARIFALCPCLTRVTIHSASLQVDTLTQQVVALQRSVKEGDAHVAQLRKVRCTVLWSCA